MRTDTLNSTQGGALLVLIAEDDAMTRRMLERTFDKWGFRPMAVDNGQRAWEILQALPVQIVVTDWDMPELTGLELCRRLRAQRRDRYTYALMLTHHEDRARMVEALEAGADDFVGKPFDPHELRARMNVARRIVNLERQLRKSQRRLEAMNLQLSRQANTDGLTGLGNRRAFDEALERVHGFSADQELGYGVALCDVDKFKQYNDTYGHPAGDKVLSTLGRVLQDLVRGADEVFRYGGEEVVLLLPRCDQDGIGIVCERLQQAVEAMGIRHAESPAGVVTVSIGGAVFAPGESPRPTAHQVVKRADDALYQAKAQGRNRGVVWREQGQGTDWVE